MKHDLQGYGSLRKCFTCGRWFHNEADAGAEEEECDGSIQPKYRLSPLGEALAAQLRNNVVGLEKEEA